MQPSLSIDLAKGFYYCFGCGERGDAISFVQRMEGVGRLQAAFLVQRWVMQGEAESVVLVRQWQALQSEAPLIEGAQRWIQRAAEFFEWLDPVDWQQVEPDHYLLRRGFSPETLRWFDVRENRGSVYPIVIPIHEQGVFRGYVARRIDGGEPKYRYSYRLPKSLTVAGSWEAGRPILVVEGMLDLLKAWEFGYTRSGALLGWACSKWQAEKLNACSVVICATDNDAAGERGFRRLQQMVRRPVVRFPFPPGVKDLGELRYRQWVQAWQTLCLRWKGAQ